MGSLCNQLRKVKDLSDQILNHRDSFANIKVILDIWSGNVSTQWNFNAVLFLSAKATLKQCPNNWAVGVRH